MAYRRRHACDPYTEYFHGTTFWVKVKGNRVYVDFTHVTYERDQALKAVAMQFALIPALEEDTPFTKALLAKVRRFQTPDEMVAMANDYFKSCWGYVYDKNGQIVYNRNDQPIKTLVRPYTVSGLCNALGLYRSNLSHYMTRAEEGKLDPGFWIVISTALSVIQENAEEKLYDRDAQMGAKFVLQSAFHWNTDKEEAEVNNIRKKTQLLQDEFELKKKLLDGTDGDTELRIEIVRKESL